MDLNFKIFPLLLVLLSLAAGAAAQFPVRSTFSDVKASDAADSVEVDSVEVDSVASSAGADITGMAPFIETDFTGGFSALNQGFVKNDRKAEGIQLYKEFLEQHPDHYTARMGLGQLLGWSGRYRKAMQQYQTILMVKLNDVGARMGLALTLGWDRQYGKAEEIFNTLLKENGNNHEARINLARILSWQNRFIDADIQARQVLVKDPGNIFAHEVLANINKWQHRLAGAHEHLTAIIQLAEDPSFIANAQYQLADVEWMSGNAQRAVKEFRRLATADSQNTRVQKKLKQLSDFLAPNLQADIYRYQEFSYADSLGRYRAGTGNNALAVKFNKNITSFVAVKLTYQLKNETSDNLYLVEQPRLYDVTNHVIQPEIKYNFRDVFHLNFFNMFNLYKNRDLDLAQYISDDFFNGFGLYGNMRLARRRLYFGFTRQPLLSRQNDSLLVTGDYGIVMALPLTLFGNLQLAPSLAWHFLDDGNAKQQIEIKFSRPLPVNGMQLAGSTFFRRFNRNTDYYFSYSYWYKLEPGVEWKDLAPPSLQRRKISLPVSALCSFNVLGQETETEIFGGLQAKLHPSYAFGDNSRLGLLLNFYINTDFYFVYYTGLRFSRRF